MRQVCVLLVTALGLGCGSNPLAPAATIVGAHDMVLVGQLMFTTSTDRDELRVLDLAPPAAVLDDRQYVRAPNPLEALSIPVLSRPSALSRDTHYEDTSNPLDGSAIPLGREVGGPWVYATSAGGSEISVVGGGPASDPAQLVEVKRIPTSSPVTASAGVSVSSELSHLFFATFDGSVATLHRAILPGAVPALRALDLTPAVKAFHALAPGQVIVDLLVVPALAGRGICEAPGTHCVIYATRTMSGQSGRVVLFDPETLQERELAFPGPVRLLATHAGTIAGPTYLAPGRRIFGVLDEERCGGTDCGGVIAVDSFTGEVALDPSGLPMLPIATGISLVTGLSVVARGELLLPPGLVRDATVPTTVRLNGVGVITTSNGSFIFFDAEKLTVFDLDVTSTYANRPNVGLYRADGTLNKSDGGFPDYVEGPVLTPDAGIEIRFANGAWQSETIDIVVNGVIPELAAAKVSTDQFEIRPPALIGRVQVGDILIVPGDPACRGTVLAVNATTITASLAGPCTDRVDFLIRAGEPNSYVVRASLTGYLGRSGRNQTFNYRGSYYQRPFPFDPVAPTFSVVLGPEDPRVEEGWRWSIDIQPAFTPFVLRIAPDNCSTNVASSVVWDTDRQVIFTVFPSANAIIELRPQFASNNSAVDGRCWR